MTRSILGYVDVFADRRKLPRIEMELILQGNEICFSPTMQEVCEMIVSVVYEVMKFKFIVNFKFPSLLTGHCQQRKSAGNSKWCKQKMKNIIFLTYTLL